MKVFFLRPETAEAIRTLEAELRLWVLTLVAWLAAIVPSRKLRLLLQHDIREARRDLRVLLFAKVMTGGASMRGRPSRRRRAPQAPPGFRWQGKRTKIGDLVVRGVCMRTLKDLRRVSERLDAIVARLLRKLPAWFALFVLVAVAPGAVRVEQCVTAHAIEAADTS